MTCPEYKNFQMLLVEISVQSHSYANLYLERLQVIHLILLILLNVAINHSQSFVKMLNFIQYIRLNQTLACLKFINF